MKSWMRIEKWLEKNAPELLKTLNPGADAKSISSLERGARYQVDLG